MILSITQIPKVKRKGKEIQKTDLKSGMAIETRNKERFLLVDVNGSLSGAGRTTWTDMIDYHEDLTSKEGGSQYDIMKVWKTGIVKAFSDLEHITENKPLWERSEY